MRLGVVLEKAQLPPVTLQWSLLETCGCDLIVHEPRLSPDARRRVAKLVQRLQPGDELVVAGLDALDINTGELVQLLRNLLEVGVTTRIIPKAGVETVLRPVQANLEILVALADHERHRSHAQKTSHRRRGAVGQPLQLTRHQIEFAKKMYVDGASPRAIGLIFQATPEQIWKIVGE